MNHFPCHPPAGLFRRMPVLLILIVLTLTACSEKEEIQDAAPPSLPAVAEQGGMPPLPGQAGRAGPPALPDRATGTRPPVLPTTASPPRLSNVGNPSSLPPPLEGRSGTGSMQKLLHLRQARIMDHQGFGRSLPAMHLLLPADWIDQGEVVWQVANPCQVEGRQFQWKASSPDGTHSFEFLPGMGWGQSNIQPGGPIGCRLGTAQSVREHLTQLARHRRPNARIMDFEDHSSLLGEFNVAYQQTAMTIPGMQDRRWAEAGILHLSFREHGQDFHESLSALVLFQEISWPEGTRQFMGLAPAPMATAYRSPAGQMNPQVVELIGESMTLGQEWNRLVMESDARISGDAIDHMNQRHQINMDAIRHVGDLNRASYNQRMGAMDRQSHQFSQTIRGVATWTNPAAGNESFELPHHYDNAWRLDDGSFILTDNPDFHPWSHLEQRGERLTRAR